LAFKFESPDFVNWVEEIAIPTRILECVELYWARPGVETRAALRFELERTRWALHESEDDNQAWAWDAGAFVGWKPIEVREYTQRVVARELAQPLRDELLTHPAHVHSEAIGAGAVKHNLSAEASLHHLERAQQMRSMEPDADVTFRLKRGLRVRDEMRELVSAMQSSGWRVYVITASPQWEVEAFAERYFIAPENVIGMRRALRDGRITAEFEPPCSWGDGKLDAYNMFVTRERLPNFVAGDSIGDWTLLEWATDCALLVEPAKASLVNFARWKRSLGENWLFQEFSEDVPLQ
jgi:phosphoserine phosphatase